MAHDLPSQRTINKTGSNALIVSQTLKRAHEANLFRSSQQPARENSEKNLHVVLKGGCN